MELNAFINLSKEEIAKEMQMSGSKACVFPINGTRRWFMLEYADKIKGDPSQLYLDVAGKRHIELYQMCFEHGLDTLLTPVFGGELLNRGEEYVQKIAAEGLSRLATDPDFLSFYKKNRVRVRFYGDYRKLLANTPFAYLIEQFDLITQHTAKHDRYRLFYGVFSNDATESIADLTVQHFQKSGGLPSRRELIEMYYGEFIDKADIFIGFEKFSVFDYPLLNLGEESLYFTVAPSLYLSESQLRYLLYDFLYLRPVQDPDYATMPRQDFEAMRTFYETNREATFGVGEMRGGIWYPKSRVKE